MRVVEKTPEVIILEVGSRTAAGKTYYVTIDSKQMVQCTCPGYLFREDCHHVRKIRQLLIKDDRSGARIQMVLPSPYEGFTGPTSLGDRAEGNAE